MVLICAPVLMGVAALAVDVGMIYSMDGETQNAVDSAALAGASALIHSSNGAIASQRALDFLGPNLESHTGSNTTTATAGRWNEATRTFIPNDPKPNAVKVSVTRRDAPLFFASVVGLRKYDLTRSAVAMVDKSVPCRVWSTDHLKLEAGTIDSYDSSVGPYNPSSPGYNGHVCSCDDIEIKNETIRGDILHGPGKLKISTSSTVTGTTGTIADCDYLSPDFAGAAAHNNNAAVPKTAGNKTALVAGVLTVLAGDSLTLPSGTYSFAKMTLGDNSSLNFSGPVSIYVNGDTTITGSVVNGTGDPWQATIYSSTKIQFKKYGASFYGSLVAPNGDLKVEGSTIYGAAIAHKFEMKNASLHVDESLPFGLSELPSPSLVK